MEEWTKLADPARFQEILRILLKYYGDLTSREADFNTHARRAIAEANQASIYVREISRHMAASLQQPRQKHHRLLQGGFMRTVSQPSEGSMSQATPSTASHA